MRPARFFIMVAILLVLQSCCRCCFDPNCNQEPSDTPSSPSGRIGTVYRDDPKVAAGPSGSLVTVQTQRDLNNHDEIQVTSGGRARLEFYRGTEGVISLVLYNDTYLGSVRAESVDVNTSDPLCVRMYLAFGLAAIDTKSKKGLDQISLPNGVDVMVRGTQAYVLYDENTGYASIGNFGGDVAWSYRGSAERLIASSDLVDVSPDGSYTIQPLPFDLNELDLAVRGVENPVRRLMDLRQEQGGEVPPVYQETETPAEPPTENSTQTVHVLVLMPLTGSLAEFGQGVVRGAELSWLDFSDELTEAGYTVEMLVQDDQSDPQVALSAVQTIIGDENILCSVGPFTSAALQATSDVYNEAGLAFVSPAASNRNVTSKGYPVANRIVGWDETQGEAAVRFAAEQGTTMILLEGGEDRYSRTIAARLRQEADRLGIQVISRQDLSVYVPAGIWPGLVYYAGSPDSAGQFFRLMRETGYYGPLMGSDLINAPQTLEAGSTLILEGGGVYYTALVGSARFYPRAEAFRESYQAKYGVPPPVFAVQGYDAMSVCLEAIRTSIDAPLSRDAVARAIRANSLDGITGTLRFDQNGDLLDAPYFVVRVYASYLNTWYEAQELVRVFNLSP